MSVPEELRYTASHEWARLENGNLRIGITDFAQEALGDVVFVQLPAVGTEFGQDAQIGEVESTKSVSELYAPVAGVVIDVNGTLNDAPEQMNRDPYGEGWLCVIEPADPAGFEALLSAAQYEELTVD